MVILIYNLKLIFSIQLLYLIFKEERYVRRYTLYPIYIFL